MQKIIFPLPIYLPRFLYERIRRLKHSLNNQTSHRVDLTGDRDIEWAFVASQMDALPQGKALEVGPGPASFLGLIAAQCGYQVTSVDLGLVRLSYIHPHIDLIQGDILNLDLPFEHYDMVINCSVVEHIGLVGRYGVTKEQTEGDLDAMRRLAKFMKPGAKMLLTIPVGRDAVFAPLHRVYGTQRLPQLLDGYSIDKKEFWIKDLQNRWILVSESDALASVTEERRYGLGCFVLRRP